MGENPVNRIENAPSLRRDDADLAAAREGDHAAFTRLIAPIRGPLHAHCYRMLGSVHDADDAVQEALLRAWRGLHAFEGRSSVRTWLFTVATRVCLDLSTARARRALPIDLSPASELVDLEAQPSTEIAWITPYPDTDPTQHALRRESLELAFIAALQHLPGNQRAALLLADVLGFSAAEIAGVMSTTATSVNSALSRARRTLVARDLRAEEPWSTEPADDGGLRRLAAQFAVALETGDLDTFVSLLTDDVTWTMPPLTTWYQGVAAVAAFAHEVPMTRCPSWRHTLLTVNGGQPAIAFYLGADPVADHMAWAIAVLETRSSRIASITSFIEPELFPRFRLAAHFR